MGSDMLYPLLSQTLMGTFLQCAPKSAHGAFNVSLAHEAKNKALLKVSVSNIFFICFPLLYNPSPRPSPTRGEGASASHHMTLTPTLCHKERGGKCISPYDPHPDPLPNLFSCKYIGSGHLHGQSPLPLRERVRVRVQTG